MIDSNQFERLLDRLVGIEHQLEFRDKHGRDSNVCTALLNIGNSLDSIDVSLEEIAKLMRENAQV